ncbi:MAG TPA: protein kinase [Thermoanaerobaculia bacterium]|nr:protein kinase [Thermoanaerobaculia bacterium]
MTLQSGTRLGPYEIVAPIGAGGMGEVFRARDTRLERSVAIKVLPAELAADAQFRLRLEREAKTISQLNHPHICTLYDTGHENGVDYLVMELIEGESLAGRLARARTVTGFDEPRLLFTHHKLIDAFEALPDGARLVLVERDEDAASPPVHVVVRWPETVGRRR